MHTLRLVSLILFCHGPCIGQQTWKVNCQGGPGIDFTDLPQAVAAAAPGDTIWVFHTPAGCPPLGGSGTYTAPTIDKPLSLLGFHIYSTPPAPGSLPTTAALSGLLSIVGIPAGQRVVISNIGVSGNPPLVTGVQVSNCAGEVILEEVGYGASGHANQVFEILNCANVTLRGCSFYYGGSPLSIVDSTVRMTTTAMWGVPPAASGGYLTPSSAISLVNSTLTVTNSVVNGTWAFTSASIPNPGVLLTNSTMYLGPGTTVRGGKYYGSTWPPYCPAYLGLAPVVIAYKDPRTVIDFSTTNVPTITQEIDATFVDFAVANDWFTTVVAGPSDGFALLMLGDLSPLPTTTPFGSLWIDPMTLMFVDIVPLPASATGVAGRDYFIPASAQNAHAYVVQSLTLAPSGVLGLTLPSPFCVGWEHGRLP